MSKTPTLSVVIPAYNELANFHSGKLTEVNDYLKKQSYSWEVIVVDDGSTDKSPAVMGKWIDSTPNWRLIKNPHYGKAKTVATGMLSAQGETRLFTDFDQATPISEVEKVLKEFKNGADVVIGSRELQGSVRNQEPFIRHLMGRVFNALVQFMALRGIADSQCGFKAFTADTTQELFNKMVVYKNHQVADAYTGAFDVELLFLARKKKLKISQIPVIWHYVDTSRVNPLKDSIRMFWDILKIRWAYARGLYE